MSRRDREWMPGHDAFMDVVANLVGILIILIAAMGRQIHSDVIAEARENEPVRQQAAAAMEAIDDARQARKELDRMRLSELDQERQLAAKQLERAALMDALVAIRARWSEVQEALADEDRARVDLETNRQTLMTNVGALETQLQRSKEQPVTAVEHLPTPMAKTVFEDEVHFRLADGKLTLVPLEALLTRIKSDFSRTASAASAKGSKSATVGPIQDYLADYEVEVSMQVVSRGGQVGRAMMASLKELTIRPVADGMGETVDTAIGAGGVIQNELGGRDPARTTITIWVYPDSFGEFRRIKEFLYAAGFPTAARPLPHGREITGSPDGRRSDAQ
jgi:hypothetical protein